MNNFQTLVKNLNIEQKQAVNKIDGPVLAIAGAGTGKTTVLTSRIINLVVNHNVDPNRILAFTFTNKAGEEMRQRILKFKPDSSFNWIRTYHSTCMMILKQDFAYVENDKRNKNFTIIDTQDQKSIVKQIIRESDLKPELKSGKIVSIIQSIKASDLNIEKKNWTKLQILWNVSSVEEVSIVVNIFNAYQKKLQLNNQCDFEDLINLVYTLLKTNKKIRSKWQNKFDYVLVDEFQDTNKKQFEILKMMVGSHNNVFACGDMNQTIYAFNGAYPKIFDEFVETYPKTKIVKMNQNYRSTDNILTAANNLISNNDNKIFTNTLKANNTKTNDKVQIFSGNSLWQEANFITNKIKQAIQFGDNIHYNDFAVLYRANSSSRVLEEVFIQNSIPYVIYGSLNFYQRAEIKDMISYIKTIFQPDETSIQRVINVPKRNIGLTSVKTISQTANANKQSFVSLVLSPESSALKPVLINKIKKFNDDIKTIKSKIEKSNISNVVDIIVSQTNYFEYLKTLEGDFDEKQQNIQELSKSIKHFFEKHPTSSIIDFLNEISLYTSAETTKTDKKDFVSLMTAHMSKGKEFSNVFVFNFNDSSFPSKKAIECEGQKGLEEERRVAYVALTRAKDRLFITCSQEDNYFHNSWQDPLKPSRFIDEIKQYQLVRK